MAIDREKTLQAAQALVEKKKYDKAIVEYRKLVAHDPTDVRTLLKIGALHLKLDQHEGAITTYEQVGDHYFREGFSVKAIAVYKQIRGIITRHCPQLETKYGHILPRLADIYTQLGLTSDALAAYDEVATRSTPTISDSAVRCAYCRGLWFPAPGRESCCHCGATTK